MVSRLFQPANWVRFHKRFALFCSVFAFFAIIRWWILVGDNRDVGALWLPLAVTIAWGGFVGCIFAASAGKQPTADKLLGFALLVALLGLDAGWRVLTFAVRWIGPC